MKSHVKPKFTLIINYKKDSNLLLAQQIVAYLQARDVELLLPPDAPGFKAADCAGIDFSGVSAAIVIGGDGTILSAAHYMQNYAVPMLGVNMGKLGFLSEVEVDGLEPALDKLLVGSYGIEERMMLAASVVREGQTIAEFQALNDLVINNSAYTRTLALDLSLNDMPIRTSRSDGIIIATPTGSTAYSFSAGGPIVEPTMELILMNFVCPHSFVDRPMIVSAHSRIKISFMGETGGAKLTADGQSACTLNQGDLIFVTRAAQNSLLIRFGTEDFFHRVHHKLAQ